MFLGQKCTRLVLGLKHRRVTWRAVHLSQGHTEDYQQLPRTELSCLLAFAFRRVLTDVCHYILPCKSWL